jgi:hypothetical protein
MHTQNAIDAYLTAVAEAAACVDTVHAQVGANKRPYMLVTLEGTRKGTSLRVGATAQELCDPGYKKQPSAHATLAHKAARAAWDHAKHQRVQAVHDAGGALLERLMAGPHTPATAVLHTSIAPGLVLVQASLDRIEPFEPAHALDPIRHRGAFTALVHASQDPLGGRNRPTWRVTTFLHPLDHAHNPDDEALCVERFVQGGTVEQALMATALTGVNALLAPGRLDDVQIWKSLEGADATGFHAFLQERATSCAG